MEGQQSQSKVSPTDWKVISGYSIVIPRLFHVIPSQYKVFQCNFSQSIVITDHFRPLQVNLDQYKVIPGHSSKCHCISKVIQGHSKSFHGYSRLFKGHFKKFQGYTMIFMVILGLYRIILDDSRSFQCQS